MTEQPQPPKEAAFFTSIRDWGLVRGPNGVVGGVVEGLGHRIGLARVPARLLVVLAWVLLPGVVMLAYAAAWGLLPDRQGNIIIQNFGRGVTNVGALIGIGILTFLGVVGLDSGPIIGRIGMGRNVFEWDRWPFSSAWFLIPAVFLLAFVAAVVILIVWLVKRSHNTPDAGVAPPAQPTSPTGGTYTHNASAPEDSTQPDSAQSDSAQGDAVPQSLHQPSDAPQPWEPALLPGDPRAGVPASTGAARASAHHAHTAHTTGTPYGTAGHSNPPSAHTPPPPVPPRPASPPAPSVPGPGKGGYLAFGAVLLISAAVAAALARADMLAVSPLLAWGAAITVGLGAILVIVALAGRKLGFLGFLSIVAVLLAVLFASNAEQIRDGYPNRWNWDDRGGVYDVEVTIDEFEEDYEDDTFDLTTELGSSYSAVFIAGQCMSPHSEMTWDDVRHQGASMASMRLATVDDDMDIDLAATFTRLAIPTGTSLEIIGTGEDNLVVWEDRDASCYSWNYDYEYDENGEVTETAPLPLLSATNPDAPVLTINAGADKSIYIEEVAK